MLAGLGVLLIFPWKWKQKRFRRMSGIRWSVVSRSLLNVWADIMVCRGLLSTCISVPTGLHSMPACCWGTRCTRAGQRQTSSKRSVTWKSTWASPENVSGNIWSSLPHYLSSWVTIKTQFLPQFYVSGTLWKLWKQPRERFTCRTACWGSAWRSAIWTKPCTLPATMWCGQERRAFSLKWTSRNGVRDLLGGSFSWLSATMATKMFDFCWKVFLQVFLIETMGKKQKRLLKKDCFY